MPSSSSAEFLRLRCPECEASLKIKGAVRPGKRIACPKCQGEIVVPDKTPSAAPAKKSPPKRDPDDEDDWLNNLGSLNDTAVNLGDTAILPPRVGGSQSGGSASIETREPRAASRRETGGGGGFLGFLGPLIMATCGGMIGGGIGAAIWATIANLTGYEIGIIAWAVGALAGVGVRVGASDEEGPLPGILAILTAFASIYLAKAAVVFFLLQKVQNMAADLDGGPVGLAIASLILTPFTFGLFDILWFGLAGFSAFKIGSGLASDD